MSPCLICLFPPPLSFTCRFGTSSYANPMSFAERAEGVQKTVADWIAKVTGNAVDDTDLQAALKDGQVLCVLINKLKPGSVRKIHSSKRTFLCPSAGVYLLSSLPIHG